MDHQWKRSALNGQLFLRIFLRIFPRAVLRIGRTVFGGYRQVFDEEHCKSIPLRAPLTSPLSGHFERSASKGQLWVRSKLISSGLKLSSHSHRILHANGAELNQSTHSVYSLSLLIRSTHSIYSAITQKLPHSTHSSSSLVIFSLHNLLRSSHSPTVRFRSGHCPASDRV